MPSQATSKFMRGPSVMGRVERFPGSCHYCGMQRHRGSIFALWKCSECGAVLCSNQTRQEFGTRGDPDPHDLYHLCWCRGTEHTEDVDGSFYPRDYFRQEACGPVKKMELRGGSAFLAEISED